MQVDNVIILLCFSVWMKSDHDLTQTLKLVDIADLLPAAIDIAPWRHSEVPPGRSGTLAFEPPALSKRYHQLMKTEEEEFS